jgi:hypothetical protein
MSLLNNLYRDYDFICIHYSSHIMKYNFKMPGHTYPVSALCEPLSFSGINETTTFIVNNV